MKRIKYTAMLALGLCCYPLMFCWRAGPSPDKWWGGFILEWAGFWAFRMPYREWSKL